MNSGTLFVDCTQLVHWPGKLTGIPRVMNELVLRYADREECEFVVWNPQAKCFYAIDVGATIENRGRQIVYALPDLPLTANKKAVAAAKTASRKVLGRLKRYGAPVPGRVLARLQPDGPHARKAVPQAGDALLILWGEQGSADYIARLQLFHANKVRLIQISYDLLPLVVPQYSGHSTESMAVYNREIFPICDLILSISDSTKRDIIAWLKAHKLRIPPLVVFRLGDDFKLSKPTKPAAGAFRASGLRGGDYILCVGTIEARKNHTLLYYVYKLAKERGIILPKLVIVGRRGWKTGDLYELITRDPDIKDQFVLLTDMNDEELSWLYGNCRFSIYPSFYEGWGLPVAESIAHGVPCLCSRTSSIPEIAGDLVDYFSPASTDECLTVVERLLLPKELDKSKRRIAAYKPHTWDQAFAQADKAIKEICNAKN